MHYGEVKAKLPSKDIGGANGQSDKNLFGDLGSQDTQVACPKGRKFDSGARVLHGVYSGLLI